MKKGFTLVELLAVIIILAAIMLIIIPLITNNVKKSTDVVDNQSKDTIILSSRNWGSDHKNLLPESNKQICINITALMDAGYLDNPEEKYLNGSVLITNENGNYYYKLQKKLCDADINLMRTVTFDYQTNGGTNKKITREFLPGDKVLYPDSEGNKAGYEFIGWNTNKDAHSGLESYTMPSQNVTLYAIYAKEVKADFVLQKMKGAEDLETSKTTSTLETCMIYNNEGKCQIKAPILTSVPGSKVIGWNQDPDAKTAEVASGATVNIDDNRTYYSIVEKTDYEAPECTLTISSGTKGKSDWYISDVGVHMDTRDIGEAGVKQYGLTTSNNVTYNSASDTVHQKDGSNIVYYGYVRDGVGNTNKCSIAFKRDTVKPTCSISLDGDVGTSSWYTGNVTVSLSRSDATSKIAKYGLSTSTSASYNSQSSVIHKDDTKGVTYYGYVEDGAGHTNSCSKWFKRDATGPTYSSGGNVTTGNVTAATFTDNYSGVNDVKYLFSTSSSTPSASSGSWSTSRTGTTACGKTIYVFAKATDKAGNYTIRRLGNYSTGSCVSATALNNNVLICPDNQEKRTWAQCQQYLYNYIYVSSVSASGTSVKLRIQLHMNDFALSYRNGRTITLCIAKAGTSSCYYDIASWRQSSSWAPVGKVFYDQTISLDISSWAAGEYKVIINGNSDGKFMFTENRQISIFRVNR